MKWLALAFLAGLVSALGFAPLALWPLTIAALAGLFWLIEKAPSLRSALARGWWFGLGQFTLGLNWIATAFTFQAAMPAWLGWVAVVLLSLYLAVYPAAAVGLAWRWGRGSPPARVLMLAGAWIATEWLRATLFTGFAWNPLSATLVAPGLTWPARWLGTYGLSGLVILSAGLFYLVLQREADGKRMAAYGLLALALILGADWLASPALPGPTARPVRIVQPNISQADKWREGFGELALERLGRLSNQGGAPASLLIWPEAAVVEPLQDGRRPLAYQLMIGETRHEVAEAMGPHALLLTGGLTLTSADGVRASGATNSVFAVGAQGRLLARYDKAHLVPYGEYLPMRPLLSAIGLSRLAPGDLDFAPGPGPRTLDLPGLGPVGFQLCYEIIFSGEVVDEGNRPNFIFNPSNDAWFGGWGPPQHLAQARLRAIEEGLPVLRATPTGISAVIDAEGHLVHSLPLGEAGVIDALLPSPLPPTLFARFGNLLPLAFAFLLVVAAIAVRRKSR